MSNIYPYGQCTWYAYDQCDYVHPAGNLGNGGDWAGSWRMKGHNTTSIPVAGCAASFQPGADGVPPSSPYGHVAVCRSVEADGTFTVQEMNWYGLGRIDTRTGLKTGPGVVFLLADGQTPGGEDEMTSDLAMDLFINLAVIATRGADRPPTMEEQNTLRTEIHQRGGDMNAIVVVLQDWEAMAVKQGAKPGVQFGR